VSLPRHVDSLPPQVYLNGKQLPVKTFQDYCEMYLGDKVTGPPRVYERVNERWEVCVSPTDGQFQQVCPSVALLAALLGSPPQACTL
jgi:hypothetical protein